jgi:hypothetical protein
LFPGQRTQVIVRLRYGGAAKRIGFNDVSARFEVLAVYFGDDIRPYEVEDLVIALEIGTMPRETRAAKVSLGELFRLDHGAHGAIDDKDTLFQGPLQGPRMWFVTCHLFCLRMSWKKRLHYEKRFTILTDRTSR